MQDTVRDVYLFSLGCLKFTKVKLWTRVKFMVTVVSECVHVTHMPGFD